MSDTKSEGKRTRVRVALITTDQADGHYGYADIGPTATTDVHVVGRFEEVAAVVEACGGEVIEKQHSMVPIRWDNTSRHDTDAPPEHVQRACQQMVDEFKRQTGCSIAPRFVWEWKPRLEDVLFGGREIERVTPSCDRDTEPDDAGDDPRDDPVPIWLQTPSE